MNKKIIVSTLALAMGAALAGSVSGTVAWFQYSTRAQVAYMGASAHCTENLQMTKGDVTSSSAWKSEFSSSEIENNSNKDIIPITSGKMAAGAALPVGAANTANAGKTEFYLNPLYQVPEYSKWGVADEANYVQFELHFHVLDVDGGTSTKTYLQKDLYLVDLTLKATQSTDNSESDLYKAIRVHIATDDGTENGKVNKLYCRDDSGDATISTNVYGNLDLNNDGAYDLEEGYEWEFDSTNERETLVYGDNNQVQVANNVAHKDSNNKVDVLADDTDPYAIVANQGKIGTIKAAEDGLKVTVTIWLEGWQKLAPETGNKDASATSSAVWKAADYIGKNFQVGMRFAVDAHEQGHN